jgi:hypothetical protein
MSFSQREWSTSTLLPVTKLVYTPVYVRSLKGRTTEINGECTPKIKHT